MPVNSNNPNPPDVEVTVTNGAGGGGVETVGVYVAWDPAVLDVSKPTPSSGVVFVPSEGFCVWYGYQLIAGNPRIFRLTMKRRNGAPTTVLACKMDPATDELETHSWPVPNNHP